MKVIESISAFFHITILSITIKTNDTKMFKLGINNNM